ncbi:glycosyltransferase family 25 protein [Pasteurella skyensis]|uniref:Glycosyltransferase family 25 protein n=1 Tax=Phocoenobacter skyensis TaxID=97481 RepID=A0AAJ6NDU9_9PAST|nr:glycosyltransferase family 25 protein [Pasteurella skyensis]MDP8171181.1 glycosyltransferase family 25 protein [Pasteurella skyensis]MDP8174984.1 glycosyltransferase family 25 protein [Pasteurella skyensis]
MNILQNQKIRRSEDQKIRRSEDQKITIFVINLEKSTERRQSIQQQFEQLPQKIDFQYFKAINGKENPDFYLFEKHNAEKRFKYKGNKTTLGQLGCFASHYLLWEECVKLNQPIVILEDDAIIHNEFYDIYSFLGSEENSYEFLWLSPPAPSRRSQKGKLITKIKNTSNEIQQFYKGWSNTTGYYITPKIAKNLLNYTQEWVFDVDITMDRYWENQIKYLAVTPACLEPDLSLESNIPVDKGKKERTAIIRLRREYYSLVDKVNKFIFDMLNK